MSQNPFESLGGGGGGFDVNALLQQAQQMQEQLSRAQEELAETVVDGSVGGVTVQVSGIGELVSVQIAPGSFDGADAESLTDLGDMVVAAFRDAKAKADAQASAALGPLAGGFGDMGGMGGLGGGGADGGAPGAPGRLGF